MRRGQSALEYLVTYGWAILAIVIVAALLWYLGIFNPSGLVGSGNSAKGFTFNVLEQKYASTTVDIRLGNTMGQKINITDIDVGGSGSVTTTTFSAGEAKVIQVTGAASCGTAGDKYTDIAVKVTYDTVGGISGKTDSGTISGVCA